MNYNLTSFVLASIVVVIVFMGSTATVAATSNQLLRGGRAGSRQLEKGNDDILIPPFTATNNTTYADDTSVSGHNSHTTSSSSNDTSNSSTINFTEEECDDCYLSDPKICWGYMHSSYCGYDTDDDSTYADDSSGSGHTGSTNDTSNSTTVEYTEEQKCDDCFLDEGSGGCTICYYPKICWGDMHSSYCGYDTDDYTDDGS
jgi:hypothetical protein